MVDSTRVRPAFLLCVCFVSGAVVMALEMLGFRLLAPAFGYSIYVWGNLLGLIMAALSLGYWLGGRLADRSPTSRALFLILLAAAISVGVTLFSYRAILRHTVGFGAITGSLLATFLVFGPCMTLLSMVSPFIIRLLAEQNLVGRTSGNVYAVSTAGSLAGVFGASFLLIPWIGSHNTLIACFVTLLALAVAGLAMDRPKNALLALIAPLPFFSHPAPHPNLIYEKDSPYFNIKVLKKDNVYTYIRDDVARSSQYVEGKIVTGDYWDFYALGAQLSRPSDILVLGMGTGTTVREYLHFSPASKIVGVELDPEVLHIAREYFDIRQDPRLTVHAADVRPFVAGDEGRYDYVEMDVFRRPYEIPFYLATSEFFADIRAHLRPGGLLMMNVVAGPKTLFVRRLLRTVQDHFPSCFLLRYQEHSMILAFAGLVAPEEVRARLKAMPDNDVSWTRDLALEHLDPVTPEPGLEPLTDDKAPVELLTFNAVYRHK